MIRTRTLVLLGVLLVVGMCAFSVYGMHTKHLSFMKYDLPLGSASEGVARKDFKLHEIQTREEARTALIQKLLGKNSEAVLNTEPSSETEASANENSSEHRGVQVPLDKVLTATRPTKGKLFTCASVKATNYESIPWVDSENWYPEEKPVVPGAQRLASRSDMTVIGNERLITTNNVPPHVVGGFPLTPGDAAYPYAINSEAVGLRTDVYTFPLHPNVNQDATCVGEEIGVALNGIGIMSAVLPDGSDARVRIPVDSCGGAPDSGGLYRYYYGSECLEREYEKGETSTLVGYALDGFGIYGARENGVTMHTNDLDSCHGHTHEVIWNGQSVVMYHYHLTSEFPYTVGCFTGTPHLPSTIAGG